MDVVDLDRLLDEFEAKEGQHSICEKSAEKNLDDVCSKLKKETLEPIPDGSEDRLASNSNGISANSEINPKESMDVQPAPPSVSSVHEEHDASSDRLDTIVLVPAESPSPSSNLASPPPDVTSDIISLNVDPMPEDPKSSSSPAQYDQEKSNEQNPPPDVVAGHQILSSSRSSTPSPIEEDQKRVVGFFDGVAGGSGDYVSEEELERYLNELEEKIGEPDDVRDEKEELNRRMPSSDELRSYLSDLERISGESIEVGVGKSEDGKLLENMAKEEESIKRENVESEIDASVIPKQVEPAASVPVETVDSDLRQLAAMEDDSEEDPYVSLTFSTPVQQLDEPGECPVNLKIEIEQALQESGDQPSDIQASRVLESSSGILNETAVSDVEESFEDANGSPIQEIATELVEEKEEAPGDKEESGENELTSTAEAAAVCENGQEDNLEQVDTDLAAIAAAEPDNGQSSVQPTEQAAVESASSSSKGQLVTICQLEASPSEEQAVDRSATLKLTESELQLGRVQPIWIPDVDSAVCMLCESKFTVIRRRHHCRACGRVLCNVCCNQRAILPYMVTASPDHKKPRQKPEARVCSSCYDRLKRIEQYEKERDDRTNTVDSESAPTGQPSSIDGPADSASTSCASTGAGGNGGTGVSSTAPVRPPVLKREGSNIRRHGEPKQVIFSDGIKPGGDLTETPPSMVTTPSGHTPPPMPTASSTSHGSKVTAKLVGKSSSGTKSARARELESFFVLPGSTENMEEASNRKWPPILNENGEMINVDEEGLADMSAVDEDEKSDGLSKTVIFVLKRNLRVKVKLAKIDCCLHRTVWCLVSDGLRNVSQDEVLIVIERVQIPGASEMEKIPPLDTLVHINCLYEGALKGKPLGDMNYCTFSQLGMNPTDSELGYFGSKDNAGFLYFRPTYQCIQNLCLPEHPFLIGVLIQKSEVSWAKIMPLRLLLRLGVEYRYYPYPLMSDRFRKPLYYETGHTIMNLLSDMRNFTYTLASIPGCTVTLEDDKTVIQIPVDQYNQVLKILQSSNEHVLAWAASLHKSADAHLVCVQQWDTLAYTSQTINRENRDRKITGACFVVFNASLKAGGATSRISIVEDGLMVQIRTESMERLRQCLHQQQQFELLQTSSAPDSATNVVIRWIPTAEKLHRFVVRSHIDGRVLTDAPRYRLHGKTVEASNSRKLLRLIELYVFKDGDEGNTSNGEPDDLQSMVRQVSAAFNAALLPYVDLLDDGKMRTVAVRFAMGADLVEYSAGSNEHPLTEPIMSAVDDILIPLLHSRAMGGGNSENTAPVWRVELVTRLLDL